MGKEKGETEKHLTDPVESAEQLFRLFSSKNLTKKVVIHTSQSFKDATAEYIRGNRHSIRGEPRQSLVSPPRRPPSFVNQTTNGGDLQFNGSNPMDAGAMDDAEKSLLTSRGGHRITVADRRR